MFKSTTWFLVFAILTVSITFPVTAQQRQDQQQIPANDAAVPAAKKDPAAADMKDVFARQTEKVKADEAVFDPIKADRERGNQQAQKQGMSKTKKVLLWTAVAVGVAALLFVAIKYAKKCIRYSDDCDYNPSTGNYDCPCEEYERRNP